MTSTPADWIQPGTRVVVHTSGIGDQERVSFDTIKKVATKSFNLEEASGRFDLRGRRQMSGGTWDPVSVVYPVGSLEVQRVIAAEKKRRSIRKADRLHEAWRKTRTKEDRLAAIEALQAVED